MPSPAARWFKLVSVSYVRHSFWNRSNHFCASWRYAGLGDAFGSTFTPSFAVCAMAYVVIGGLVPEAGSQGHSLLATLGAILGFRVIMNLEGTLGWLRVFKMRTRRGQPE